jgi:plastocyanin
MMRRKTRLTISLLSFGAIAAGSLAGALWASASGPQTLVIGVDNLSPKHENFAFLDYYPRAGVTLHNGDVLGFHSTPPTSDEIHTATLGIPGETPLGIFTAPKYPAIIADLDDPAPAGLPAQLQLPNAVLSPENPPAGAPGGCGTQAQPCNYDGSAEINSGILCQAGCPNSEYFYKINLPSVPAGGVTVHYVCLIHGPVMSGSFTVVPDHQQASTQRTVNRAARKQFAPQVDAGFDAKEKAIDKARESGQIQAGAEDASGHVQVLEMLPQRFNVQPGTSQSWINSTLNEIHTVTFPAGSGSDAVDPLPAVCEGTPDTPATFPGGVPCGNPALFEDHLNPQPQGVFTITSPTDVGTSGIIASIPGFPGTPTFSFSFPTAGTFTYECRVHNHMTGTIIVSQQGDGEGGD